MARSITAGLCIMCLMTFLAVAAYGQEGECRFKVAPTTIHFFDVWGGTAEIRVTASSPNCRFSVETKYPWISVRGLQQDGTEGKVLVAVEGNNSLTHRVGSLSVDGWEVSVIQAGPRRGSDGP